MRRLLVVMSLVLGFVGTANLVSGGAVNAATDSYVPIAPIRIADSRPDFPSYGPLPIAKAPTTTGGTIRLPITRWIAAQNASAVAINVTATRTTTGGYLTVYPCDTPVPGTSNLNLQPGNTVANLALSKVSASGEVCIHTVGTTHVIVDLMGIVPNGATQIVIGPLRVADSRPDYPRHGPSPIAKAPMTAGGIIRIPVTSWAGAQNAKAVAVNVTATRTTTGGYLTVYSCDTAPPGSSNLNLQPGNTVANLAFSPVGVNGEICIYAAGTTDVIVDLVGAIPDGAVPAITAPLRALDTRPDYPNYDGRIAKKPTSTGGIIRIEVVRYANARNANSVVLNVTAARTTSGGYLSVYSCDTAPPETSNLNLQPGNTVANLVTSKIGVNGEVCIYSVGTTDVIVDILGSVPNSTDNTSSTTTSTTTSTTSTTLVPPVQACSINGTSVPSSISQTECNALVAFYNSTNGANWNDNTGWNTAVDPCTWNGVKCTNGSVTAIEVDDNALTGAVPPETANLTNLTSLDLGNNKITGIPADLPKVTRLDLSFNQLTEVPAEVFQLTDLTELNLSGNPLTTFPIEVTGLTNLTQLKMYGDDFTAIPADIAKLTKLTKLDLSFNDLTEIPPEIAQLTALEELDFNANEVTTLPVELGQLTNLSYLGLYGNKITGDVSAVFAPLAQADSQVVLLFLNNACPTASDPAVKAWLDRKSPNWDQC